MILQLIQSQQKPHSLPKGGFIAGLLCCVKIKNYEIHFFGMTCLSHIGDQVIILVLVTRGIKTILGLCDIK